MAEVGPRTSDLGSQTSELWVRGKGIVVSIYFESAVLGYYASLTISGQDGSLPTSGGMARGVSGEGVCVYW